MISGAEIFGWAIAACLVVCMAGRYVARQKLLRGRHPLSVAKIVESLPENISRMEASEVLRVIGKSFGVKPEILRLEDRISALTEIDTWTLGRGQEVFEKWLIDKGITSLRDKPITIRDLIVFVTH